MDEYYHITPIENIESIKSNGIINNGEGIFVIDTDDLYVIQHVSLSQIFCDKIAVFKIDVNGFRGKRYHDNVAELVSRHQFYSKQKKIEPRYIELYKEYTFSSDDRIDFIIKNCEKLGIKMDRNQVVELYKLQEDEG